MNYYFQVPMHHLSSAPWRGFALHSRNQIGDTERTRPFDEPITPPLRGSRLPAPSGARQAGRLMRWGDYNTIPYASSIIKHARILR